MKDRAMQAHYLLALEPVAETTPMGSDQSAQQQTQGNND